MSVGYSDCVAKRRSDPSICSASRGTVWGHREENDLRDEWGLELKVIIVHVPIGIQMFLCSKGESVCIR